MLLALDFDGTLAPIVPVPEDAASLPAAAAALRQLVDRRDTDIAIVSGRALEDVRERVGLPGLFYAGNHGMEIEGPGVERRHAEAERARPSLAACVRRLEPLAAAYAGVTVEDKGLTLSVHYRRVEDADAAQHVRQAVYEACGYDPALRLTEGKKIVEVRPAVEWDKGRAVQFLLESLEGSTGGAMPALFVGDDRTDEDAFRVLRGRGDGVVVHDPPPPDSAATAYLRSPEEVADLLAALAQPDA